MVTINTKNRFRKVEAVAIFIIGHRTNAKLNDLFLCEADITVSIIHRGMELRKLPTDGRIQMLNANQLRSFVKELALEYDELPELEVIKIVDLEGYFGYEVLKNDRLLDPVKIPSGSSLNKAMETHVEALDHTVNIILPDTCTFEATFELPDFEDFL